MGRKEASQNLPAQIASSSHLMAPGQIIILSIIYMWIPNKRFGEGQEAEGEERKVRKRREEDEGEA